MTPMEKVRNAIIDILEYHNIAIPEDSFEQANLCLEVLEKNQAPEELIEIIRAYEDALYEGFK